MLPLHGAGNGYGGVRNKSAEVPNPEKLNHTWIYKRINNNNVSNPVMNRRFMFIPASLDGLMAKLHSLHAEPELCHCIQFRCFPSLFRLCKALGFTGSPLDVSVIFPTFATFSELNHFSLYLSLLQRNASSHLFVRQGSC